MTTDQPVPDSSVYPELNPSKLVMAEAMHVPIRICDDCASRYIDWWADERLWQSIVGAYEGSLCPDCFGYRCHQKGIVTVVVDSMNR
jgi:hypothetical protein